MKELVHLVIEYEGPILCGRLFGVSWLVKGRLDMARLVRTYIAHPNLTDYHQYNEKDLYQWCPDCIKHPEVIIAKLNETNV